MKSSLAVRCSLALADHAGIFSRETFWALSPSSVSIPISFSSRAASAEGGVPRRRLPITVFSCRGAAARRVCAASTCGDQPGTTGARGGVVREGEDGGAAGMGAWGEENSGIMSPVVTPSSSSAWRSGVDETPTCARMAKVNILSASAGGAGGGSRGGRGGGGPRGIECSPGVPLRYGLCRRQVAPHARCAKAVSARQHPSARVHARALARLCVHTD